MRYSDGSLIGDLDDSNAAYTSRSLQPIPTSSVNENLTEYDLLPVVINDLPIILQSTVDASSPSIRPSTMADATGNYLYRFPDGDVRVAINSSFTLRIRATQPNIFNVENGIPTIIKNESQLVYVWKFNDVPIGDLEDVNTNSSVKISGNQITFNKIQPSSAGTYVCEVANDIGKVIGDPIRIEVFNPDFDEFFYKNLILNPYGQDGTNNWNSTSDDFIAKQHIAVPTIDLKTPYRVDFGGYTNDMYHPRPYQLDVGHIRGIDYMKDMSNGGSYFTRKRYVYQSAGGRSTVKAYQDIDLTKIQDFINGSMYGIDGVRAVFGCYLGQGVTGFRPTTEVMYPDTRLDPELYSLAHPRLSVENLLLAGAGFVFDRAFVTIEEFDQETPLVSRLLNPDGTTSIINNTITLMDPWTKRIGKYFGIPYYTRDKYKIGQLSKGDYRDMVLWTAEELYPKPEDRPTYGQYAEFNRIILERLNPKTNKLRVSFTITTEDFRFFDGGDKDSPDGLVFEWTGWDKPLKRNSFDEDAGGLSMMLRLNEHGGYKNMPQAKKIPTLPETKAMATGFTVGLFPIDKRNPSSLNFYINSTLVKNTRPQTNAGSALVDAPLDITGANTTLRTITLVHDSSYGVKFFSADNKKISAHNRTTIIMYDRLKSDPIERNQRVVFNYTSSVGFYPFTYADRVWIHRRIAGSPDVSSDYNQYFFIALSDRDKFIIPGPELTPNEKFRYLLRYGTNPPDNSTTVSVPDYYATIPLGTTFPRKQRQDITIDVGTITDPQVVEALRTTNVNRSTFIIGYAALPAPKYIAKQIRGLAPSEQDLQEAQVIGAPRQTTNMSQVVPVAPPSAPTYNFYYLTIQPSAVNTGSLEAVFTRDASLRTGFGFLETPISTSIEILQDGNLYFDLPNELITRPLVSGGLGMPKFVGPGGADISTEPVTILTSSVEALNLVKANPLPQYSEQNIAALLRHVVPNRVYVSGGPFTAGGTSLDRKQYIRALIERFVYNMALSGSSAIAFNTRPITEEEFYPFYKGSVGVEWSIPAGGDNGSSIQNTQYNTLFGQPGDRIKPVTVFFSLPSGSKPGNWKTKIIAFGSAPDNTTLAQNRELALSTNNNFIPIQKANIKPTYGTPVYAFKSGSDEDPDGQVYEVFLDRIHNRYSPVASPTF